MKTANSFAVNTTKAANSVVNSFATTTASALNSLQELPSSIAPANSGSGSSVTSTINSYFNSLNTGSNKNNNRNNNSNYVNVNNSSTSSSATWAFPAAMFLIFVAIFTGLFYVYNVQLGQAYNNIIARIKVAFGYGPPATNTNLPDTMGPAMPNPNAGIIEKILPVSQKEVFNVSSNEYSYYDAEPLCRAMGAELATYDQVKKAWENGADWCNYGWVKGQVAVYPTQRDTWEKLQGGPDEEKGACGNPGVNGGYFDNPELKFGVSCYGNKPPKSSNDQRILMEKGAIPRTTEMLKVDERVQEFKNELGTIGLLPFNGKAWDE